MRFIMLSYSYIFRPLLITILCFTLNVFSKNTDSSIQHYVYTQEFINYYESLEEMTFLELIKESTKHSIKVALVKTGGSLFAIYPLAMFAVGKIVDSAVNKITDMRASGCENDEDFRLFDNKVYELPQMVYYAYFDKEHSVDHKSYWKRQAVLEVLDKKYGIVSLGKGEKYKIDEVK